VAGIAACVCVCVCVYGGGVHKFILCLYSCEAGLFEEPKGVDLFNENIRFTR
jgi:hypothetical protein